MIRIIFAFVSIVFLFDADCLRAQEEEGLRIDDIMWQDPSVDLPPIRNTFRKDLGILWSKALARPDSELRRTAADTVAVAHQRGVEGMTELTQYLVDLLKEPSSDASVRRAAAHALVVIEARDQATLLADAASRGGYELALFVEPALAKWAYAPMREVWLQRLRQPEMEAIPRLLAIRCLAELEEAEARAGLLQLVHDQKAAINLRLEAARALSNIFSQGLNDESQKLSARGGNVPAERLLAVMVISSHGDDAAIERLREFAVDPEPTIAAVAWDQLLSMAPEQTYDLAPAALKNRDVNVRRFAARAMVGKADPEAIRLLGPALADTNPALRQWVARSLVELAAQDDLREIVIATATEMLNSEPWRGLEQAGLVLVTLDQRQTAPRMIALLDHPRREVAVTAAWAMRRFQMPEHLPVMLRHAEKQTARFGSQAALGNDVELIIGQLSQLFQAFGQMKYQDAGPIMRRFVPKRFELGVESRSAACWALGHLYAGQAPEDLTKQFVERLSDISSQMPEVNPVRRSCAASLGRMNSTSAIEALQTFSQVDGITTEVGQVCYWALERLTGQKPPPIPTLTQNILGWFIQPNE